MYLLLRASSATTQTRAPPPTHQGPLLSHPPPSATTILPTARSHMLRVLQLDVACVVPLRINRKRCSLHWINLALWRKPRRCGACCSGGRPADRRSARGERRGCGSGRGVAGRHFCKHGEHERLVLLHLKNKEKRVQTTHYKKAHCGSAAADPL